MSHPLIIFACVLRTIEHGPPPDERCHTPYVHELVAAITKHSAHYGVPAAVEAAKIYHESHYDKHAVGAAGEVGLGQLLRHGAIQGADLRLTRRQLEDVDTNIRISVWYLSRFVRECDRPSRWLTKYNRPARGCRPSRYSLGVLADLRAGRNFRLARALYDTEASGSTGLYMESTSTSAESTTLPASHTARMSEDLRSTTPLDSDELRRPAGTRRAVQTPTVPRSEEELAVPFQEP